MSQNTILNIAACSRCSRFDNILIEDLSEEEQEQIVALALSILEERNRPGRRLLNPADSARYVRLRLAELPNEVFGAVFLDSRHQIVADEALFRGTLDGTSIYPRVVVQKTLEYNAAAVIFYHNHPSGITEPSMADERITQRLQQALATIDVRVLDHFVVGYQQEPYSFAEHGLL